MDKEKLIEDIAFYIFERNCHSDLGWQFQTKEMQDFYIKQAKDILNIMYFIRRTS